MKQALSRGDLDLIKSAIEQISSENAVFAQILQSHLDNFDYPKIINLITESEEVKKLDDSDSLT
jgi:hypothetical protein